MNRRRILTSLVVIGVVGAVAGASTTALFSDQETSQGNEFTAGELDLLVDWKESYNGEKIDEQELTNNPGSIFSHSDLKPGDYGEATISLHLEDNPGWIWMNLNQTSNWDNSCTEPEHKAEEGNCGSEGELDEELKFVIWADDGDNVREKGENVIFKGTAEELEEQSMSEEGILLDGNSSTDEIEPFPGEETGYIGVKWKLPKDTGNRIQGDSVTYDVTFYTEQERHNENPDNPWTDEPDKEPVNTEDIRLTAICTDDEDDLAQYRISNQNSQKVTVSYDVYQQTNQQDVTVNANSQKHITVPAEGDEATTRLFYSGEQIDVKANNPDFCDLGEPNDEEPVDQDPEAVFTAVAEGNNVTFNASNSTDDNGIESYDWDFGDSSTGSGEVVEHTYEENGTYTAELTVTDTAGNTDSATVELEIGETDDPDGTNETEYTAIQGDQTIQIEPLEGDIPVEELYDFRLPDRYDNQADNDVLNGATYPGSGPYYESAGTDSLQQESTSIMFLYEGPDGLSFVVVHDQAGGDGGSATWTISDLPSSGQWVVKDDLYLDADGTKASSNYDNWNVSSNPQTIDWTWGGGGTDGGAFSPLGDSFSFTIDPAFNEEATLWEQHYSGTIDDWQVLSGNMSNPERTSLDLNDEVTVEAQ